MQPWTNPTCALADMAAIVQHLLLRIRSFCFWYLDKLPLRIAFPRAAYNDALLEDNISDFFIHTTSDGTYFRSTEDVITFFE